jgi:hypothetical protein
MNGVNFNERVIGFLMLASAVYMPFQVGSSDTNLLLLWLFCFLVSQRWTNDSRIPNATKWSEVIGKLDASKAGNVDRAHN